MTTEPEWLLDAHQRASERMADAERAGLDPHDTLMAGLRAAFKVDDTHRYQNTGIKVSMSGLRRHLVDVDLAVRHLIEWGTERELDFPHAEAGVQWFVTAEDWAYEHQPSMAIGLVLNMMEHVALLKSDPTRVDEFFQLYVDTDQVKETT